MSYQGCANVPHKGSLWQDIPLPWQPEINTNGAAIALSILSGLGFQSMADAFQDLVSGNVARGSVAGSAAGGQMMIKPKSAKSPETIDDFTQAQVESNCQHEPSPELTSLPRIFQ